MILVREELQYDAPDHSWMTQRNKYIFLWIGQGIYHVISSQIRTSQGIYHILNKPELEVPKSTEW